MTLSKLVRKAALYTAIGATALTGLGMARDSEATELAEAKTIVVTPFKGGDGANGSKWYGPVRLSNTSHNETADGVVYALPQQDNNLDAAAQFEYHIPPRQSMIIDNLHDYFVDIGNPQDIAGNVSLRVQPSDEIDISVAAFVKNVQNLNEDNATLIDPNNTNVTTTDLLQGLQGIGDSEFLLPGDYVTIMAPDTTLQEYGDDPVRTKEMNRLNLFTYGRQDAFGNDPEYYCELFTEQGTPDLTKWFDGNTNGGTQITNFIKSPAGMNQTARGNENIKCTVTKGEMLIMPSVAKNNVDLPGVDDGYSMIPEVTRLVETEEFTVSPPVIEANDPWAAYAGIKSRLGTEITTLWIDLIGRTDGNGTNELIGSGVSSGTVPGVYDVEAHYTVRSEYGDFERTLPTRQLEIVAEENGYVASREDVESYVLNNLERASFYTAYGLAGGWATKPSDWESGWPTYFDGVNEPPNNVELDYIKFLDIGDGFSGNVMQIYDTNGDILGVGGIPEKEFDLLKERMNAQLP